MNMKQTTLITIIMVALALTFTTCKHEDDGPKNQSATINPFENYKVTVKGTFTDTEWAGAANKIENAIKGLFESADSDIQNILRTRFAKCKTIFIEKTTEYSKWKTTGDGESIYINYSILDAEDLRVRINNAIASMDKNETQQDYQPIQP